MTLSRLLVSGSARAVALFVLACSPDLRATDAAAAANAAPILHSHNDYERARPLGEALEHRAGSVEADIYLVEGRLLVAHDREDVRSERTLQTLYLDPLRERARRHGGRVYADSTEPLILLVDIKSEAGATYAALAAVLAGYAGLLSRFEGARSVPGAVTVIVSGNRDRAALESARVRHAAMDGRGTDLGGGSPASLIPLVSDNWSTFFTWRGEGPMPGDQRRRLHELSATAKREGRLLRFWNTPDLPAVWAELLAAGIPVMGTDDLAGLRRYLGGLR
ncbi:MAG TPA: phosphatidylinositol-specific phospholipase C/glycerophosphodiester phosphodiesterase family protein [Opitutaceae bacterium]